MDNFKSKCCLILCGDFCPTSDYLSYFKEGNAEALLGTALPLMKSADYLTGNMEFPLIDNPEPIEKAGPTLYGASECIKLFQTIGVNALSMANNHIFDCGPEGIVSSLKVCRESGIAPFGIGENPEEILRPHYANVKGIKIGFIAFAEREFNLSANASIGAHIFDDIDAFDEIAQTKKDCDYLVVLFHGGIEHYRYPSPRLQKRCRRMVNSGADLVLCQHSHIIGSYENYLGGHILYGQGNTLFGYEQGNDGWNDGLLVELVLTRSDMGISAEIQYHPIEAGPRGVCLLEGEAKQCILQALEERSQKLSSPEFLQQRWLDFCRAHRNEYYPNLFAWGKTMKRVNRRLFHRKLIDMLYKKRQKMMLLNIIRCFSHYEIIRTLLEEDVE